MKHSVYVISAGRYNKLPFDEQQKSKYIFCVKNGEGKLYEKNGCKNVYETFTFLYLKIYFTTKRLTNPVFLHKLYLFWPTI